MDHVTVLPSGKWDPTIRLDPPAEIPTKENRLEKADKESIQRKENDSDKSLEFTGRFCGGLIDDIKRKAPWFLSDFKDALDFQCISSVLFMYFACISSIITFGGLLGAATDQNMVAHISQIIIN